MNFSEAHDEWRSCPEWASFLTEFGFAWLGLSAVPRRIALVSMPCDSAAAGLIALGAMRKFLEDDDATDARSHYQRLLDYARARTQGVFLKRPGVGGRFTFDGIDQNGNPIAKKVSSKSNEKRTITRGVATQWQICGEAPVAVLNEQQMPNTNIYAQLVKNGGELKQSNLIESHSQICLAGRVAGEAVTKEWMRKIRLELEGIEADLSQMLTVQDWLPGTVSRVLFYNPRTEKFDRRRGNPQLVIADGGPSFLKVVDGRDFENSDVIGVYHKAVERVQLEDIGTKLHSLRQWYDPHPIGDMPQPPRGIDVSILIRRQACQ